MSFDLPADLQSRVARYAEAAQIAPAEAVRFLVEDGLRNQGTQHAGWDSGSPSRNDHPESTIGLFDDLPDFIETIEKVVARREERYSKPR